MPLLARGSGRGVGRGAHRDRRHVIDRIDRAEHVLGRDGGCDRQKRKKDRWVPHHIFSRIVRRSAIARLAAEAGELDNLRIVRAEFPTEGGQTLARLDR